MANVNLKIIIFLLFLFIIAVIVCSCTSKPPDEQKVSDKGSSVNGDGNSSPAKKAEQTLPKTAEQPLPKLIDLGAKSCIPCKKMAPILEEMEQTFKGKMDVEFIDVYVDRNAAMKYKIRVIPTQIFYAPDGTELYRHQGFYSREDILGKWKELGYEF